MLWNGGYHGVGVGAGAKTRLLSPDQPPLGSVGQSILYQLTGAPLKSAIVGPDPVLEALLDPSVPFAASAHAASSGWRLPCSPPRRSEQVVVRLALDLMRTLDCLERGSPLAPPRLIQNPERSRVLTRRRHACPAANLLVHASREVRHGRTLCPRIGVSEKRE